MASEGMHEACNIRRARANDYPQLPRPAVTFPQIRVETGAGGTIWDYGSVEQRFLTLADVAETLNISASQAYALVRSGDLPAIKVGGRGQWRVEATALEDYIQRMYEQTRTFIAAHPDDDISDVDSASRSR